MIWLGMRVSLWWLARSYSPDCERFCSNGCRTILNLLLTFLKGSHWHSNLNLPNHFITMDFVGQRTTTEGVERKAQMVGDCWMSRDFQVAETGFVFLRVLWGWTFVSFWSTPSKELDEICLQSLSSQLCYFRVVWYSCCSYCSDVIFCSKLSELMDFEDVKTVVGNVTYFHRRRWMTID